MATKSAKKLRLWRLGLTRNDYAALQHIQDELALDSATEALRLAVAEMASESLVDLSEAKRRALWRISESARDYRTRGKRYGAEDAGLASTTFWFSRQDFDNARTVKDAWAFDARTDAVRFALRVLGEKCGYKPDGGW